MESVMTQSRKILKFRSLGATQLGRSRWKGRYTGPRGYVLDMVGSGGGGCHLCGGSDDCGKPLV